MVRAAQEIIELSALSAGDLTSQAAGSAGLRKEPEFAFYGDIDFVPTEQYDADTTRRAIDDAELAVAAASPVIAP